MTIIAVDGVSATIAADAYVHPEATLIGDVTIGSEASVWPTTIVDATLGPITVGARTNLQDGARIRSTVGHPVVIADDAVIAHLVIIEGAIVGEWALVGSSSEVYEGAVVEGGGFVAAKALVEAGVVVPAGAMAMGRPAIMKPGAANAQMIEMIVQSYVDRGHRYATDLREVG